MKKIILILLLSTWCCIALATTNNTYQFNTPEQQTRFLYLTEQYRCLVCQNEALADSNAPLAQDLRAQIAILVQQNKSNEEITHYLTTRYGDFILFRPPFKTITYLLWLAPFVLVLGGILLIFLYARQKARQKSLHPLASAEQQKLKMDE